MPSSLAIFSLLSKNSMYLHYALNYLILNCRCIEIPRFLLFLSDTVGLTAGESHPLGLGRWFSG